MSESRRNYFVFSRKKNSSKSFFFTKVASSLCTPYERPQWRSILQRPIGRRAKICVASIVNNNNTITNNSVSNDYIWRLYEKKEVCIASASETLYSFSTNMVIVFGKYYQIYCCCFWCKEYVFIERLQILTSVPFIFGLYTTLSTLHKSRIVIACYCIMLFN